MKPYYKVRCDHCGEVIKPEEWVWIHYDAIVHQDCLGEYLFDQESNYLTDMKIEDAIEKFDITEDD